jgi:phage tail-like protein
VNVILMNEKSEPLRTWKVAHAIPKKWMVTDFNANDNTVVIETMELSYRYFTIQ